MHFRHYTKHQADRPTRKLLSHQGHLHQPGRGKCRAQVPRTGRECARRMAPP